MCCNLLSWCFEAPTGNHLSRQCFSICLQKLCGRWALAGVNTLAPNKRQVERKKKRRDDTALRVGKKKGISWAGVEAESGMKPSLCRVRSSAVRDERIVSTSACRNAYTHFFCSALAREQSEEEEEEGRVQTFHRDTSGSIFTNSVGKQTQASVRWRKKKNLMRGWHCGLLRTGLSARRLAEINLGKLVVMVAALKLPFPFPSRNFGLNYRIGPQTKSNRTCSRTSESAVHEASGRRRALVEMQERVHVSTAERL